MTISNKGYFILWRTLLILLILIVITDLALSQISGSLNIYFKDHIPALVSGGFILFLASIRINYFSYEDEYEIIHIHSKSLLFSSFRAPFRSRYEFPKRIIHDFEYKENLFQKRLTIYLETQQGVKKIRKFYLSFVPMSKLRYVINSLEKIKEENSQASASIG